MLKILHSIDNAIAFFFNLIEFIEGTLLFSMLYKTEYKNRFATSRTVMN